MRAELSFSHFLFHFLQHLTLCEVLVSLVFFFTSDCSKAVVSVLFVLCVALWLLAV